MIVVHHLDRSRSHRVLWLLEELELPYELIPYRRDPNTLRAPPELRAIHPLGKAPVVTDGGAVLAESGAILEALVEKYGQGRLAPPSGTPERLRYLHFMHYAEGSAMPYLLLKLVADRLPQPPMPLLLRPVARAIRSGLTRGFIGPELEHHTTYLIDHLKVHTWFAGGEFSAADIQMSFVVQALVKRGLESAHHERLRTFIDRIEARPAYQRAITRGGPFEIPS